MKQSVTIHYRGIELELRGKYLAWEPAPNDGGYIDEIEIIHAGQDIFPLLEDTDTYHAIHGMAYNQFFGGKK